MNKVCFSIVLDKTLKGIRGVRLDNRKVFRAPGPRTIYIERFLYCSINSIVYLFFFENNFKIIVFRISRLSKQS